MHCGTRKVRCCVWRSVFQVRFLIWIIDSSQASSWDYCNYALWGLTYIGSFNVTEKGLTCQRWDSNWPHAVNDNITDANFPDGSKRAAQNFCRNPYDPNDRNENFSNTPWCYTTDPNVLWQYCRPRRDENGNEDLTAAYNACVLQKNGAHYSGSVAFTKSGFTCDLWSQHRNSTFVFPDGSDKRANNYCRNPTPTIRKGPWCYTTSDLVLWDYCDVCIPFRGAIVKREHMISKERVRLPSMPLANCLHWCITFMSCVGIDFKRDEVECWYTSYKNTTLDSNKGYDHYDIKRICPEMTARSISDGGKATERTALLQKHTLSSAHRLTPTIHGTPETVFGERNSKAAHSILLAEKLKRWANIEGPEQPAPADGAGNEITANRSMVREGSEREAGLRNCRGTPSGGESRTESTYRVIGARGTASRSERLLRQKRSQILGEPEKPVSSGIQKRDATDINEGATVVTTEAKKSEGKGEVGLASASTAETIHFSVDDFLFGNGTVEQQTAVNTKNDTSEEAKKSKLAGLLCCLMIVMAVAVFLSTMYAFVKISFGKKTSSRTAKPEAGTTAINDKPDASKKSVSHLTLRP